MEKKTRGIHGGVGRVVVVYVGLYCGKRIIRRECVVMLDDVMEFFLQGEVIVL